QVARRVVGDAELARRPRPLLDVERIDVARAASEADEQTRAGRASRTREHIGPERAAYLSGGAVGPAEHHRAEAEGRPHLEERAALERSRVGCALIGHEINSSRIT